MIFPIVLTVVTVLFLNRTKVGTATCEPWPTTDNTALLGVPVRRVEATAWFGSGVIFGFSGLLLATLVSMEIVALTFSIPIAALAAALIGTHGFGGRHPRRGVRDRHRASDSTRWRA